MLTDRGGNLGKPHCCPREDTPQADRGGDPPKHRGERAKLADYETFAAKLKHTLKALIELSKNFSAVHEIRTVFAHAGR